MTNKLKYFVGNWKMFGDFGSFKIAQKINKYANRSKKLNKKRIILCVPNTLLDFFKRKLKSRKIFLGAQNCHHQEFYGAFTGSVSSSMLKKVGAQYIIIGHSENRLSGDTDQIIKKKTESAINQNLNVIFCIGETLNQKKSNQTLNVLRKQIKNSLNKNLNFNKIIIAYEPVWSIGSNKIPSSDNLRKIILFIKKDLEKIIKKKTSPKVLYGGSVNHKNIRFFSKIEEIDGFLIGGASQSAKKFIDIIENYYK